MDTIVYFFDIGGTVGTVELSSQDPLVIKSFTPLPNVGSSLRRLRSVHRRLGIISDIGPVTGEAVQQVKSALASAGLLSAFENELLLFGTKKQREHLPDCRCDGRIFLAPKRMRVCRRKPK